MTKRWIIGLASGCSGDGVDAALLETEGVGLDLRVRLAQSLHQPFGRELRETLRRLAGGGPIETRQLSFLHRILGEAFAAAACQVADRASLSLHKVQCLGYSGHTIWHEPEGRLPCTLGLGMAAVVAERTGVTTVSDLRARDVVVGGQGMPLAALVDALLFGHAEEDRVLVHLGSSARIIYLPACRPAHETIGFEAGPCSLFLDGLMRQVTGGREEYDAGGKHAVQGRCLEPLLRRWLAHPYLQRRPPKSLPRHYFGDDFIGQAVHQAQQMHWPPHDLLCTATQFVAHAISDALKRFLPGGRLPDRVLLSGGAVRNGLLWRFLEQHLEGIPLEKTDRFGIPAEARKALAVGMLAALTVDGVPANVPAATGAAGARLLGSLTPGSSANWARCLAWMANQMTPLAVGG